MGIICFPDPLSAWAFAAMRAGMGEDRGEEVEVLLPEGAEMLPLWAIPAFYEFAAGGERIWAPGWDEGEAVLLPPPMPAPGPEGLAALFREAREEELPAFRLSAAAAALGAAVRAQGEAGLALAALALREEMARRPALAAVLSALGRPLRPVRCRRPAGIPRSRPVLFLLAGGSREAAWAETELRRRVPEIPDEELRWALERAGPRALDLLGRRAFPGDPGAMAPQAPASGVSPEHPGLAMALAVAGRLDPQDLPSPWREKAQALRGEPVDLREVTRRALSEWEEEGKSRFWGPILLFLGPLAGGRGAEALWEEEALPSFLWEAVICCPPPPGAHPGLVGVHRALRGDPEGIRAALRSAWPSPEALERALFLLVEAAPPMALPDDIARLLLERATRDPGEGWEWAWAGELLARLAPRWAPELLVRSPRWAPRWLRRMAPETARAALEAAWPAMPPGDRGRAAMVLPDPDPGFIVQAWEDLAEDLEGSVQAVAAWAGRVFLPGWAERVRAWALPRWEREGTADVWAARALQPAAKAVGAAFAAGWEIPEDLLGLPGWVEAASPSPAVLRRLRSMGLLPARAADLVVPLARAAEAIAADPAFRAEAGRVLEEAMAAKGASWEVKEAFAAMRAAAAAGRADLFRRLAEGPAAPLARSDLPGQGIQEERWALPPDLSRADREVLVGAGRALALPGLLLALGEAAAAAEVARRIPDRLGAMPPAWAAFPGAWEAMAPVLADALASPAASIRRDALWAIRRADGPGGRISPRVLKALQPALRRWLVWEDHPDLLAEAARAGVV